MSQKKRAVTIETVAAEAGVSKTTVSFVINDNPTISAPTRKKVREVIERLGYQPNVNARNLSSRRTRAVTVLVPEIARVFEDPYFARALSGIQDELEAVECRFSVRKASLEFVREKEHLNLFRRAEIGGMLYVGSTLLDGYLADLVEPGHPFVFINSVLPGVPLHSVCADHVRTGRLATEHLIRLGHRRIAHVAGIDATTSGRERREGYRTALEEAGISLDEALVVSGEYDRATARAAAERLLALADQPTALFVSNDVMAVGILDLLAEKGIRVPEEIAVVGGDSIEISTYARPPLTSVDQDIYAVAREAVRLLLDLMEEEDREEKEEHPLRTLIEPRLVVRRSCGAA
jgi:DNA-binding LacI/PurR family transcriptional regulator